jgi:hypothetical protein
MLILLSVKHIGGGGGTLYIKSEHLEYVELYLQSLSPSSWHDT